MSNEIISVSVPQMDDDLDILEDLKLVLKSRGFYEVDVTVEYETDAIRYRFQRLE
jgi:hypothetical protein